MKKLCCVFLSILTAVLLSGCWSRTEPKTLSLLNSILYDVKEDGSYTLTKEIMKLSGETASKGGGEGQTNSVIPIICRGKTIAEAARDEFNGRLLYGGFLKARLFTENLAQKGMGPVMDFLTRDPLTDEMTYMVLVDDPDPSRIYASITGLSDMIGNHIEDLSQTQPSLTSESIFVRALDFIRDYNTDGKQPVMGRIKIAENESKPISKSSQPLQDNRIIYSGLAAFKGDRLVGYMDGTETRAYNFVTNQIKSAIISSQVDDYLTTAKVKKSKAEIKTRIENEQATITVKMKISLIVVQEEGTIDVNEIRSDKLIEQGFNTLLEEEIKASIQKAQKEFESDIFGFGTYVHIQQPKDWEKIKTNWDTIFSEAKVNVTVVSSIVMSGESRRSFSMEEQAE